MVIMTKCCCCGVRTGSIVVAVWTLLQTTGSVIQNAIGWSTLYTTYDSGYGPYLALYIGMIVFNACLGIAAVCLFIGIYKYIKALLIPYLILQILLVIAEVVLEIVLIVVLSNGNIAFFNFFDINVTDLDGATVSPEDLEAVMKIVYIILLVVIPLGILLQLLCFLCVMSFYQQLRDGHCHEGSQQVRLLLVNEGDYPPPAYDACPPGKSLQEYCYD